MEPVEQAGRAAMQQPDCDESTSVPIDTYIVKVASRCNLNCSYCYVYNMGDEGYKSQPRRMSTGTASALISRIGAYCGERDIREVTFVFHGGEPLLAGKDFFRWFVNRAVSAFGDEIAPTFTLQTNGTRITGEWLDLFHELGIGFGISFDGPPSTHDSNRVNHSGTGSYFQVRQAIDAALADRRLDGLFGGVLTVVDLSADPLSLYEHYREIGLRRCDFLLPDGTYDRPAPGLSCCDSSTPYADWLITIFDAWFRSEDSSFSIRIFEDIIKLLFSPTSDSDALGGDPTGTLVIETDGSMELSDVLKICGRGFTKLGLNVLRNPIREAYSVKLARLQEQGATVLCETCRACPVAPVCRGGYLPHRHSSHGAFANPSVYCHDLMKLITHIRNRILATIPEATREKLGMRPISYEQALALLKSATH